MGIKTIKEFGNDEDSYYTSTIVSTQFTTSASLFAAQAQFVFSAQTQSFLRIYTVAIASSSRADMFCNGRSRGGGMGENLKNPKDFRLISEQRHASLKLLSSLHFLKRRTFLFLLPYIPF